MRRKGLRPRQVYKTETAATATLGLRAMKTNPAALVLLDLQLPDADGLQTLERLKKDFADSQVIILTAHDSLNNAIESIKRGAFHFISKPYAPEELLSLAEQSLEKRSLLQETQALRNSDVKVNKRPGISVLRPGHDIKSTECREK